MIDNTTPNLGTHVYYVLDLPDPRRKTLRWSVATKRESAYLGEVKWYSPWRRYCFFPDAGTVFEEVCLAEIGGFVAAMTRKHKMMRAYEKTHA